MTFDTSASTHSYPFIKRKSGLDLLHKMTVINSIVLSMVTSDIGIGNKRAIATIAKSRI